jgi:MFS family permease
MSQPAALPIKSGGRSSRMALTLLILINLFNYIDRQVLPAILPSIEKTLFPKADSTPGSDLEAKEVTASASEEKEESPNKAKLGLLQGAFMFSYFLFSPLFGWLADRLPRWKIIGVGVILWSLASGASGLASIFWLLFLTRCFVGLGEAAYGPSAPTIISDLYPIAERGRVMAWFYAAIPVGSALGYVLGGMVLEHIHVVESWRWAFYLVLPPGILLGLWCFFMKEPVRGQAEHAGYVARKATREDLWVLLRTPSYVLCSLGMTAMTFAMGGIAYWLPYYLIRVHHMKEDEANFRFGLIVVLAGLSATILGGILGDRLRPRFAGSYFLVSGIAMLVGFPLISLVLVTDGYVLWVCIFLACFALFFNTGPTNTILANVTHPQIRASAFAINIFVIHALGDAVSPSIIGLIADHYGGRKTGLQAGFLAVSAFVFLGGLLWLWGIRYLARDTAAVSGEGVAAPG